MLAVLTSNLIAGAGWLSLLGAVVDAWPRSPAPEATHHRWKLWGLLALALICFRWPLLWVSHQQNPDESQLIAGALTLSQDPVFWRSVDGGTAGPLSFFPLLPVVWGDGPTSYAIARFIALVLVFSTLVLASEAAVIFAGVTAGKMVLLPAVTFYAFSTNPDFNHYSTEIVPSLLLAAAGYVAIRGGRLGTRSTWWLFAVLTGSVLWAKLQAMPLAAALWSLVAIRELALRRSRSLLPLIGGALAPTLLVLGIATLTGEIGNVFVTYFAHNLAYVDAPQFTWSGVALAQWENARTDGYFALWLVGSAVAVALSIASTLRHRPVAERRILLATAFLLGAGGLSALGPRRPSTHHLYLIVLPLTWFVAAALGGAFGSLEALRRKHWAAALFLGFCFLPLVAWRLRASDPFLVINTMELSAERHALTKLVRATANRNEPLAMWGWRCSLYVEAGRRQATRQAHTEAQINESRLQPYFLQRYLEDFQNSNPTVFVDAAGPGNFAFDSRRFVHEIFPPPAGTDQRTLHPDGDTRWGPFVRAKRPVGGVETSRPDRGETIGG